MTIHLHVAPSSGRHTGHVTSQICKDNWLEFKSLWLGFKTKAYGQGVGSTFKLRGSVFSVRV